MTNELRIAGKVLNAYIDDEGHFVCTIINAHEHCVDGYKHAKESAFRCFLADRGKSAHLDIQRGDRVLVTGYLNQDMRFSATGNERKRINIYITDIEVTAKGRGFDMADYAGRVFGM